MFSNFDMSKCISDVPQNLIPNNCDPFVVFEDDCVVKGFFDKHDGVIHIQEVEYKEVT